MPFAERTLAVNVTTKGVGALQSKMAAASGSVSTFSKKVGVAGGALAALSAGGMAKSVQAAGSFNEAMQESLAVMGDVSQSMEEDLRQKAREVATSTTHSHEQAAESFYFLASAGLDAQKSIEAMPEVAALAEAGNLEMADATDYATDTLQAFGLEAQNISRVTDALTGTVINHNQTMRGMGEAMQMVAPIASGLGVSIEETSAALGILGDAGIKGSKAGRTLRMAFKRLTDPSKQVQETLQELGVSVQNSQGEMRDFSAIIRDLNDAGASTADVMQIFGARAGPGMQVLLDRGADAVERQTKALREQEGVTRDVAEQQRQTFNKQLAMAKDQLRDVAISIGSTLIPALTSVMNAVMPAVKAFQDFNKSMGGWPATILLVGTFLGGLAAVLGAFSSAVLSAVAPVASLATTMAGAIPSITGFGVSLGAATAPVWALIAALGSLIVIGAAVSQNFMGLRDRLLAAWVGLSAGIHQVLAAMSKTTKSIVQDILNWVIGKINTAIDFINQVVKKAQSLPGVDGGSQLDNVGEIQIEGADRDLPSFQERVQSGLEQVGIGSQGETVSPGEELGRVADTIGGVLPDLGPQIGSSVTDAMGQGGEGGMPSPDKVQQAMEQGTKEGVGSSVAGGQGAGEAARQAAEQLQRAGSDDGVDRELSTTGAGTSSTAASGAAGGGGATAGATGGAGDGAVGEALTVIVDIAASDELSRAIKDMMRVEVRRTQQDGVRDKRRKGRKTA